MYKNLYQCQNILDGIQSIDFFLARELCQAIVQDELLFHTIMATSEALRNGHSCLKLNDEAETLYWHNPDDNKPGYQFPTLEHWQQYLSSICIAPEDNQPLVYEHNRLYLRRYWQFEEQLGLVIRSLMDKQSPLDIAQGKSIIDALFPEQALSEQKNDELDWQKIAVANALGRQFTIIAGGPGTGKTFTVTKLLAALQALSNNTLRIAMVAPTGKAAQRLNESIQKAKSYLLENLSTENKLLLDETLHNIPDTASTVHRLLGFMPGSHNFRYNENKMLPFNVILVDEISMIDLPLMSRLLRAIDPHCCIIMLGDADQLPSVAAGSVLADLAPRQALGYSAANSQLLGELTGFNVPVSQQSCDYLTVLQKSHRFDGKGEIGQLARQVIDGDAQRSWHFLQQGKEQIEPALAGRSATGSLFKWFEQLADEYYVPLFSAKLTILKAFEQLNKFRFLAATRVGEQGVTQINEYIERYLRNRGLITAANEFYPGRPIMVTENHYHLGLYNGDTGLLWFNDEGKLQAAFPDRKDKDSIRWLSLGRLPAVETVYAMTIHKTQGSEFSHVALVLPRQDSPVLSRELLYTGITRASSRLSVWAEQGIWAVGVKRKVQRYSGLNWRVFNKKESFL